MANEAAGFRAAGLCGLTSGDVCVERVRDYGAQVAIVLGSGLHSLVQNPSLSRTFPTRK